MTILLSNPVEILRYSYINEAHGSTEFVWTRLNSSTQNAAPVDLQSVSTTKKLTKTVDTYLHIKFLYYEIKVRLHSLQALKWYNLSVINYRLFTVDF